MVVMDLQAEGASTSPCYRFHIRPIFIPAESSSIPLFSPGFSVTTFYLQVNGIVTRLMNESSFIFMPKKTSQQPYRPPSFNPLFWSEFQFHANQKDRLPSTKGYEKYEPTPTEIISPW